MLWGRHKNGDAFLLAVNPTAPAERDFRLKRPECSIGTDESNDLIVRDSSVSRRHAQIRRRRRTWQVIDCESTNGTYVGERKAGTWTTLRDGAELRFGAARFIFRSGNVLDASAGHRAASGGRSEFSRLRLLIVLIPIALIAGFAAAQYFYYRSYHTQEASLHNSSARP